MESFKKIILEYCLCQLLMLEKDARANSIGIKKMSGSIGKSCLILTIPFANANF